MERDLVTQRSDRGIQDDLTGDDGLEVNVRTGSLPGRSHFIGHPLAPGFRAQSDSCRLLQPVRHSAWHRSGVEAFGCLFAQMQIVNLRRHHNVTESGLWLQPTRNADEQQRLRAQPLADTLNHDGRRQIAGSDS
ncbi:hypothetical protein OG318_18830 [Streptomyces sp. NBC_01483]|nr:hypothetical protein [Streptomyces sp. NBC_01483]